MIIKQICKITKCLLLGIACWVWIAPKAQGDGGMPRFSGDVGEYRMTVFTEPTPLRAGRVDVSVMLENLQTGEFATDEAVTVLVSAASRPGAVKKYAASAETATNQLFQAATFELPTSGVWNIKVEVRDSPATASGSFEVVVGPPLPRWLEFSFWIGLPLIPILIFAARESVKWRERQSSAN